MPLSKMWEGVCWGLPISCAHPRPPPLWILASSTHLSSACHASLVLPTPGVQTPNSVLRVKIFPPHPAVLLWAAVSTSNISRSPWDASPSGALNYSYWYNHCEHWKTLWILLPSLVIRSTVCKHQLAFLLGSHLEQASYCPSGKDAESTPEHAFWSCSCCTLFLCCSWRARCHS